MRIGKFVKYFVSSVLAFLPPASAVQAAQDAGRKILFWDQVQTPFYFLGGPTQDWVYIRQRLNFDLPIKANIGGSPKTIPGPEALGRVLSIIPTPDALWSQALAGDPLKSMVYKMPLDGRDNEWEPVAELSNDDPNGAGGALYVLPLAAENLFLCVASSEDSCFIDENFVASYVAILRLRDGKLEFGKCLPLAFGAMPSIVEAAPRQWSPITAPEEVGRHEKVKGTMFFKACVKAAHPALKLGLWPPGIYGKYLTLYGQAVGCIWVIDLEKSALHHTFYLDKVSADDLDALEALAGLGLGAGMDPLILGAAFAPDGKLIVAKRHPELVKVALKLAKDPERARDRRKLAEDLAFFLEAYHEVVWLSIDLETKSVEDITAYLPPDTQPPPKRNPGTLRFVVLPSGKIATNFQTSGLKEWEAVLEGLEPGPKEEAKQTEAGQGDKVPEGAEANPGRLLAAE